MEEETSRKSKPNEFVIPENEVYAMTAIETCEVIEFLMTKLEPVHIEDLNLDDRVCTICQLEFCVSEDVRLSHSPVKTSCGHVFCKNCIIRWLDPLCYWGPAEGTEPLISELDPLLCGDSNPSCPNCRNAFFPEEISREPMEALAARLWLWDNVYAFAGVAWSKKEEISREYLWKFVNYCRSINEFEISDDLKAVLLQCAFTRISDFAERLKSQTLTPVQEGLRKSLEKLGEDDINEIIRDVGNGSHFSYVFDPMSLIKEEDDEDEEEDEEDGEEGEDEKDGEGKEEEEEGEGEGEEGNESN